MIEESQLTEKELSVVIPVFNSYESLPDTHAQLIQTLLKHFTSFEIIYVLDGGMDKEWEQLIKIQHTDNQYVNIVRLNKNFGQHHATYCGLIHASAPFCVTIDDDLQFPPDEIPRMYQTIQQENLDLLYGSYAQNNQEWWRRLSGKLLRKIANVVGKGFGKATSFRIIRANLIEQLNSQFYSYIFLDEVFLQFTNQIGYLDVKHHSRTKGTSNYTFWSLTKLALTIIIFHSSTAIRLVTKIGLIVSVTVAMATLLMLFASLIGWLPFNSALLMDSIIILLLSLILFSLGIIGEFVKKIYSFSSFQPSFVIKEKIWATDSKN